MVGRGGRWEAGREVHHGLVARKCGEKLEVFMLLLLLCRRVFWRKITQS